MTRRITVALLATLALALVGGAATSEAGAPAIHPYEGKYLGQDANHRQVTFEYRHGRIINFKVERQHGSFPEATVSGDKWHHTCKHPLCTRGQWVWDYGVAGFWNNSTSGGDVAFEANAIAF